MQPLLEFCPALEAEGTHRPFSCCSIWTLCRDKSLVETLSGAQWLVLNSLHISLCTGRGMYQEYTGLTKNTSGDWGENVSAPLQNHFTVLCREDSWGESSSLWVTSGEIKRLILHRASLISIYNKIPLIQHKSAVWCGILLDLGQKRDSSGIEHSFLCASVSTLSEDK